MDKDTQPTGEIPHEAPGAAENRQQAGSDAMPTETVTSDQLAGPLAENMPVPTAAKETVQTEIPTVNETVPVKSVPVIRDKTGKLFDPVKHSTDDLGQPRFNKNGFFISKNIGNPGKKSENSNTGEQQQSKSADPSATFPTGESSISDTNGNTGTTSAFTSVSGQPDQYDRMAEMYLETGYGIAAGFLGDGIRPEFKVEKVTTGGPGLPDQVEEVLKRTPEGKQEHESLRYPLASALREKQVTGMSPTQMFLASLAAYVSRKAAKPTVRERFTLLALKIRSLFKKAIPSKN